MDLYHTSPLSIILISVVIFIVMVVVVYTPRWYRAVIQPLRDPKNKKSTCPHCGYIQTGTEIPRCPECGKARGFDRTFQELGIDEKQVIDHVRTRRENLQNDPSVPKNLRH